MYFKNSCRIIRKIGQLCKVFSEYWRGPKKKFRDNMPVKPSFHVYQISGFIQVLGGKTERFGFPWSWKVLGKWSLILKILKVCEKWIIHRKLYKLWTFPFTLKSNSFDTTMVNILASELWGTGCNAWEFKGLYVSRNLPNLALEFRRRQKCLQSWWKVGEFWGESLC